MSHFAWVVICLQIMQLKIIQVIQVNTWRVKVSDIFLLIVVNLMVTLFRGPLPLLPNYFVSNYVPLLHMLLYTAVLLHKGRSALCPDIPTGPDNLQRRLWNPCCPSGSGPLAQRASTQVTSDSSTQCRGLTHSLKPNMRNQKQSFVQQSCVCVRINVSKKGSIYPVRVTSAFHARCR